MGGNRIAVAELPPRYQAQVASALYPEPKVVAPTAAPKSRAHSESKEQQAIIAWFKVFHRSMGVTDERLLFAVPNGGRRSAVGGSFLVREGLRAGVPDLFLSVARNGWHGLYLEIKADTGQLRPFQKEVIYLLQQQGYSVHVCYGFEEARGEIERYLKL
jgi:hypothetical protein